MMFTNAIARQIANGQVSVVYRRWAVARVTVGSLLHTTAGTVRIEAVDHTEIASLTEADAAAAGESTLDQLMHTFKGASSDPVFRVAVSYEGPDPRDKLSMTTVFSVEEHLQIGSRLERLDRRAAQPWTHQVLRTIANNPGRRARSLAEDLGFDPPALKLHIRKLKNLGLTLSLDTGYEISPRGRSYLDYVIPAGPTDHAPRG